jgi:hypothetical protein
MHDIVNSLHRLYPTHPLVMQAAAKIEEQSRALREIATSMKRDWNDPAQHANWCVERAQALTGL